MKIKAILGLMLGLFVAVGQASYSEDDAKARLLREYDSIMKEREKNMTDSEKMDVEVKRIKARMDEINGRIDNYHKANEMIDGLEKNLKELERKMGE